MRLDLSLKFFSEGDNSRSDSLNDSWFAREGLRVKSVIDRLMKDFLVPIRATCKFLEIH